MSREEANRSERVPFGMKRSKLKMGGQDPNYVYRWVNDTPGRIDAALAGGYQFADAHGEQNRQQDVSVRNNNLGKYETRVVGTGAHGKPEIAYYMRIQKSLYDSDQKAKQRELDELDKAIKRGQTRPVEHGYVPAQGISVTNKVETEHD